MMIRTWGQAWGRWTARSLRVAVLTAGLVLAGNAVVAQSTPGAPGRPVATKKTFTKNTTFNLPIQMDERTRASLKEVQLYVKSGQGDWVRQEVVTPDARHFQYRVPQDGEYWFSLVTVDRTGRAQPADVNAEPPALRVVVDTRMPSLDAQVVSEGTDYLLKINIADTNPDPQSVRALVVTDAGDRALTPQPGQPNTFRLSSADLNLPVRMVASDLSGNMATRDAVLRDLLGGAALVRNDQMPASLPGAPLPSSPLPSLALPPAPPTGGLPVTGASNTPALPTAPGAPHGPLPGTTPPAPTASVPTPPASGLTNTVYRPSLDQGEKPANRKLINTTHAQVEYRIDTVGPSGIGRVDIYLTHDRGQSWAKHSEDIDKRSPLDIELPGEGLFGVRLAITNGNGFGGRAPQRGDRPNFFIEVDATSPNVQLHPYEMVPQAGAVDIRWTATDNNLAPEPVNLFYRTRNDGAWQAIARNVKNEGVHRWVFPRDIGPQFFLKVEVADLAGNVTRVETPTPILLDMTEPEATLLDVVGVTNRAPAPVRPASFPGGN